MSRRRPAERWSPLQGGLRRSRITLGYLSGTESGTASAAGAAGSDGSDDAAGRKVSARVAPCAYRAEPSEIGLGQRAVVPKGGNVVQHVAWCQAHHEPHPFIRSRDLEEVLVEADSHCIPHVLRRTPGRPRRILEDALQQLVVAATALLLRAARAPPSTPRTSSRSRRLSVPSRVRETPRAPYAAKSTPVEHKRGRRRRGHDGESPRSCRSRRRRGRGPQCLASARRPSPTTSPAQTHIPSAPIRCYSDRGWAVADRLLEAREGADRLAVPVSWGTGIDPGATRCRMWRTVT